MQIWEIVCETISDQIQAVVENTAQCFYSEWTFTYLLLFT